MIRSRLSQTLLMLSILMGYALTACTPNSVKFGGCQDDICYEMGKLPIGWTSQSSVERQVLAGPEGKIIIQSVVTKTVEEVANDWIKALDGLDYEREVRKGQFSTFIYVKSQLTNQNGEACLAAFERVDRQVISAVGYPGENIDLLCDIFDDAVFSYSTSYAFVP